MVAERDIPAGEQIYNFYGEYSNAFLLLTHGFTEEICLYDDELWMSEEELCKQDGIKSPRFFQVFDKCLFFKLAFLFLSFFYVRVCGVDALHCASIIECVRF